MTWYVPGLGFVGSPRLLYNKPRRQHLDSVTLAAVKGAQGL